MENISILDQIISNQKAEEVARLDAVEIINNLFGELSDRERDVLVRRHGLHGEGKETLESIGNAHELTRERIRQIETTSVKKLQGLKNLDDYVSTLKKVIFQLLEEHGGLMERDYLLELLVNFSVNGFKSNVSEKNIHKNYLNFMITKLLFKEFEEVTSLKSFLPSYKLKYQNLLHLEEVLEELLAHIREKKAIYRTEELIRKMFELSKYNEHRDKIKSENSIDISKSLESEHFNENAEFINENKSLYSILRAAKHIEQNKFGHWGIYNWREIKPKTINDKIYLILKNHGKPLHFGEIADRINQIGFDKKKANAATVHNELILDSKYVLVGRGLYGLKDWGYEKGTVADVIESILAGVEEPIGRDDIIDRVMEKRLVKKATIILALMNKEKFKKIDGKYILVQIA